jgi:uncharacterized protein involved in response to NO
MYRIVPPGTNAPPPPAAGIALFRLAFRPFYLLAATTAVLVMSLWLALVSGHFELKSSLPPVLWHAHEMLFGVVSAAIIGFTLTAAKTWTSLPTPRGTYLCVLACLWCAARIASLVGSLRIYSAIDVIALPLATASLLQVLLRANSKRNFLLASVLVLLSIANIIFHSAALGLLCVSPVRVLYAAIALVVLLETIIAGRVIPAFSVAANPAAREKLKHGPNAILVIVTALGLFLWVMQTYWFVTTPILAYASLLHAMRWGSWARLAPFDKPILWILHVSYAWIPLGLGLLAASQARLIAQSPAIHALTVGSMGGLVIGMMTRTARGHTGRVIEASAWEVASYLSIATAAVVRVFGPLLSPQLHTASILVSGVLWICAFAIFLVVFTPWLVSRRVDGREG